MIHQVGVVHRDIKPSNIIMGNPDIPDDKNRIYIIDFGLSTKYHKKNNKEDHITFTRFDCRVGTLTFMSVNSHRFHSQSRRDDLLSLAYVLGYLGKGKLPWSNLMRNGKSR